MRTSASAKNINNYSNVDDLLEDQLNRETVVLGSGCFWCTEAIFKMLKGVLSVVPGYAGGEENNPTYEEVATGKTGHAEVIKIEYDPNILSFRNLLTAFFYTHDPTTLNRQGNDIGTQYRSIILYTNDEQKKQAREFIDELNRSAKLGKPIVTQLKALKDFFEAEKHIHDYYKNHPEEAYCSLIINPKVKKAKEIFAKILKDK